jgi:phosphoribosylanthranilate isomerase
MTWVKICGTTNLEDALTAVDAGADAVGFVFYEKSPRNVSVETVREIAGKLPEAVEKIGVFVMGAGPDPMDVLLDAGLTGTQSYVLPDEKGVPRERSVGIGLSLLPKGTRMLMALPMNLIGTDDAQIANLVKDFEKFGTNIPDNISSLGGLLDTFVLDSGGLRQPGGTGRPFDWERAVPVADAMKRRGLNLVVAGGLTPDNVGEAIAILKPWGVDVSSGVEAQPGKKDPEKVRAFVQTVREADRKAS